MRNAIFGRPETAFVRGGTQITVHLVPVLDGELVAFDVAASPAIGRWLPWDVLPWRGSPYTTASELADEWCEGSVSDLRPADVLSLDVDGGGWELALIFRAELMALPSGDEHRTVVVIGGTPKEAIQRFAPVELARWVHAFPSPRRAELPAAGPTLVF